ncbi:protease SohB [Candidatus Riesia pediculicola]|uniref:Probable protease SohB n=2 Tax=Candidatus Riesia pediculicola TaxID=401619 RepID=D4G886_RIEPU|nr:protease SohB [Candidatus Riesia pediculicola]ADD79672.1 probable protease SohB [Candidatus Riesia pediculicola USDA]ARC53784.1 peptidase [Candidatus Riesia pediculicola]
MEFFLSYGLFLSKIITVFVGIVLLIPIILSIGNKKKNRKDNYKFVNLTKKYLSIKKDMMRTKMSSEEYKSWIKYERKKEKINRKISKKEKRRKSCLFLIHFKGSLDAEEVNSLREEITAILSVADKNDEVLLILESSGGTVNGYGLAAAQLMRLKEKKIKLTVSIDRVAASGGYMMACTANHIIAAPLSIVGSIGVVGQIPNFHRFLKKQDIDVELHTAGEYKRTLTLLGENTESGRKKFIQDLNNTHLLFKAFVQKNRPNLNIDLVSNGEYWYGIQAKENGLIDEIGTSDGYILKNIKEKEVIKIKYIINQGIFKKFMKIISVFL